MTVSVRPILNYCLSKTVRRQRRRRSSSSDAGTVHSRNSPTSSEIQDFSESMSVHLSLHRRPLDSNPDCSMAGVWAKISLKI